MTKLIPAIRNLTKWFGKTCLQELSYVMERIGFEFVIGHDIIYIKLKILTINIYSSISVKVNFSLWLVFFSGFELGNHSFSTHENFSEKLTFLAPWYVDVRVGIRGQEMLTFWKILRTYWMNDPLKEHTLHKKWSFLFRISAVNVTKSAVSCGFRHTYWINL